ncbi:MAG: hypothetical protein JSR19_07015 [Proteobacteria bacterium]|nr:hypothetical protein [Pseudomonadota bacterium]
MLTVAAPSIPATPPAALDAVYRFEEALGSLPQIDMPTQHVIHAGLYARTITVPAGCAITGALIKRTTLLVINGDATVFTGQGNARLKGYNVLPASAGRKQAFLAHEDTHITMIFPTCATSVEEAEREFTDEHDLLMSHANVNDVIITGE